MSDLAADTDVIRAYAKNLEQMHNTLDAVKDYAKTSGCDKSGFTGLLTLLHPAVDLVDDLFNETIKFGHDRLNSLVDGMNKVAEQYDAREKKHAQSFKDIVSATDDATINA